LIGTICSSFASAKYSLWTWITWPGEVANREIEDPCYILDNSSLHNVDDITEAWGMLGGEFTFFPPYFPVLNLVEECIADVKRAIRTEPATTLRAPLLNLAALPDGTGTYQREQIVLQAVTASLHVITPQLMQTHQSHMLPHFPQIFA
jgi:hypothetical protein